MTRQMAEWPSRRGPITKTMPSDGCKGDRVTLAAAGRWYDSPDLGVIWRTSVECPRPVWVRLAKSSSLSSKLALQPKFALWKSRQLLESDFSETTPASYCLSPIHLARSNSEFVPNG